MKYQVVIVQSPYLTHSYDGIVIDTFENRVCMVGIKADSLSGEDQGKFVNLGSYDDSEWSVDFEMIQKDIPEYHFRVMDKDWVTPIHRTTLELLVEQLANEIK